MSIAIEIDGVAAPSTIAPSSITAGMMAHRGDHATCGFDVDDMAGWESTGHRLVTIDETACTAQPRLFTGWVGSRSIGRSADRGMLVGDDRAHDVNLEDINAALGFIQLSGSTAKRPAETWTQRLTWLLAQPAFTEYAEDTGYVMSLAVERDLEPRDHLGNTVADVLDELVERVGDRLNYYLWHDPAADAVSLFLDYEGAATNVSSLQISNDPADVDLDTVFPPDGEAKLTIDPSEVFSEVRFGWANGTIHRRRPSTAAAFARRGIAISRPYVKTKAMAEKLAEAFLDRHDQETEKITCTVIVPAEKAGLITAGQRITCKFTHLPGYENGASMRVAQCIARPLNDVAAFYALDLELLFPKPAPGEPGSGTGTFDYDGDEAGEVTNPITITLDPEPAVGSYVVAFSGVRGSYTGTPVVAAGPDTDDRLFDQIVPATYTEAGTSGNQMAAFGRTWEDGDGNQVSMNIGASKNKHLVVYVIPVGSFDSYDAIGAQSGTTSDATVSPPAGSSGYLLSASLFGVSDSYALGSSPTNSGVETYDTMVLGTSGFSPLMAANYRELTNASGSYSGGAMLDSGSTAWASILVAVTVAADETEDLGADQTQTVEADAPPTVDDDAAAGYIPGQKWVDSSTTPPTVYVLTDATEGAAVWTVVPQRLADLLDVDEAAPSDADVLTWDDAAGEWVAAPAGALVVADDDASVTVDPVTTLQFEADDFAVSDEGGGVAKVTFIGTAAVIPPPIVVVVDGGGVAIAAGVAVAIPLPNAGEFTAWTIVADQAGDIAFDLQVAAWADYPPGSGDSIVGAAPPAITGAAKGSDSTLSGWSPTFAAGDVLRVVVASATTVEHVTLTLERT